MDQPRTLLDAAEIKRCTESLAEQIARLDGGNGLALIGIRTHGVTLARRIQSLLAQSNQIQVPLGIVDITLYRDDLAHRPTQPIVRPTEIDFDVTDRTIILVDDVLYTGRTIRCALDEIIDFGRPRAIRLAVLIDRGQRELPIQADITGKVVDIGPEEEIVLSLDEDDGEDAARVLPARKNS